MPDKTPAPTMEGFTWTSTPTKNFLELVGAGDGWCVRNTMCQLFGWPEGSNEWLAFIEGPSSKDLDRLCEHLGLEWYDPEFAPHVPLLKARLDHPGIFLYASVFLGYSHAVYEPYLRNPRWLAPHYYELDPNWEFFRCIVDVRQEPHIQLE